MGAPGGGLTGVSGWGLVVLNAGALGAVWVLLRWTAARWYDAWREHRRPREGGER